MIGQHAVTPAMLEAGAARIAALKQRSDSANQNAAFATFARKHPLTTKGLPVLNRHPLILDQLRTILPPARLGFEYRADTRLARDLAFGPAEREQLAGAIEEAWQIQLARSTADAWRTLADVCDSIAAQLQAEAA